MTTKKLFVLVVVFLVVAQVLAACAPTAEPTQAVPAATQAPVVVTEAPAAPAASSEPIVVAIWSGPEHDNLVKVAEEYKKKTGKEVIVEEVAREAYFDKLNTVTANCGKDYDAFMLCLILSLPMSLLTASRTSTPSMRTKT